MAAEWAARPWPSGGSSELSQPRSLSIHSRAVRRNRGIDRAYLSHGMKNPFIDYIKVAQGPGVRAQGPIEDLKLPAAIRRGIEVVKSGEPYLIDTVTQPR